MKNILLTVIILVTGLVSVVSAKDIPPPTPLPPFDVPSPLLPGEEMPDTLRINSSSELRSFAMELSTKGHVSMWSQSAIGGGGYSEVNLPKGEIASAGLWLQLLRDQKVSFEVYNVNDRVGQYASLHDRNGYTTFSGGAETDLIRNDNGEWMPEKVKLKLKVFNIPIPVPGLLHAYIRLTDEKGNTIGDRVNVAYDLYAGVVFFDEQHTEIRGYLFIERNGPDGFEQVVYDIRKGVKVKPIIVTDNKDIDFDGFRILRDNETNVVVEVQSYNGIGESPVLEYSVTDEHMQEGGRTFYLHAFTTEGEYSYIYGVRKLGGSGMSIFHLFDSSEKGSGPTTPTEVFTDEPGKYHVELLWQWLRANPQPNPWPCCGEKGFR